MPENKAREAKYYIMWTRIFHQFCMPYNTQTTMYMQQQPFPILHQTIRHKSGHTLNIKLLLEPNLKNMNSELSQRSSWGGNATSFVNNSYHNNLLPRPMTRMNDENMYR